MHTAHSSRTRAVAAALVGASLFFSGCATAPTDSGFSRSIKETFASDDPCSNNARNIGLLAGAVGGALLGKAIGDGNKSILIGAVAGAALGGFIGADMDRRRCELHRIAQKYQLETTTETIALNQAAAGSEGAPSGAAGQGVIGGGPAGQVTEQPAQAKKETIGFSIAFTDKAAGGHFQSGSARLTPEAEKYFGEVAALYRRDKRLAAAKTPEERKAIAQTRLLLIGHTDDEGSTRYNADLSEQRARAVASFLKERGVPEESLYFQGAGETLPIADNREPAGRAKNRRVELVELVNDSALSNYLDQRAPRIEFYRPVMAATKSNEESGSSAQAPVATIPKEETAAQTPRPSAVNQKAGGKMAAATEKPALPKTLAAGRPAVAHAASSDSARSAAGGLDLGGIPAKEVRADFGELVASRPGFSLISAAHADTGEVVRNCAADRPRVAHGVKSLQDGTEFRTRDYLPGLYGSSWTDMVNGHLLALNKVAVLKDGGAPARAPELLIYRDYAPGKSMPLRLSPEVNTYRGSKGLLYRLFIPSENTGIRCMDVVFPYQQPFVARDGYVVQERGGARYAARYAPRIAQ